MVRTAWRIGWVAVVTLVAAGCAIEPQPLQLGAEECAHCRMVVSEPQFAAQALNTHGKAFTFDAVECMAGWVNAGTVEAEAIHSLWVADHAAPHEWVRVEEASFLRTAAIHTPMGMGVVALRDATEARRLQRERGGDLLTWAEVLRAAEHAGDHGHAHAHAHH